MNGSVPGPFSVGAFTVTPLLLGEIVEQSQDWFHQAAPDAPQVLPMICLHVAGPDCSVMVDACDPALYPGPDGPVAPDVRSCLARAGIAVEAVTHVILTHGHHDHYCGVWDRQSDQPVFANARHVLSTHDWQGKSLTKDAMKADGAAADPAPLERLDALGLLDLDRPRHPLPAGISLLDAPGETDGHRAVQVASGNDSFFFLADLFHLSQEIDDLGLCPLWSDPGALLASRESLTSRIRADRATFMCSHMAERHPFTRLHTAPSSV